MAPARKRKQGRFQSKALKREGTQKASPAKRAAEGAELASDAAITERKRNELLLAATGRFIKSGIKIRDVYGVLDD